MNDTIKHAPENALLLEDMAGARPVSWRNPSLPPAAEGVAASGFSREDAEEAEARLRRFAPCLASVFPETRPSGGLIESPLEPLEGMEALLRARWGYGGKRRLYAKLDSHLPVSGSIKARGGFYEVLCRAEALALEAGLIDRGSDYARLDSAEAREFFSGYSLAVGSTGNLGLSVGLMGRALGFSVTVHMSAEARQWKKDMLRGRGVTVIEYESDYGEAVRAGRAAAEGDPRCHFVDDENSRNLFLGYAVAGLRLPGQLAALGLAPEAPLAVYLPCGVGGGPGGVTFGLKLARAATPACFFVEPVQAPAVALGLITGKGSAVSGADIGLGGRTAADGLAVSRPSALVCKAMRGLLDGLCTVPDEPLFAWLAALADTQGLRLEPSALAGFAGYKRAVAGDFGPAVASPDSVHIIWATGGSLVPRKEWERYYEQGARAGTQL